MNDLRQERKNSISTDCIHYCAKYLVIALLPAAVCALLTLVANYIWGKNIITVYAPHEIIGNITSFVATILGFLFSFLGISLGFSGTPGLRTIFSFPITTFQYWCNLIAPMLYGLVTWLVLIGVETQIRSVPFISTFSLVAWCIASLACFLISFMGSSISLIRVITESVRSPE